jgi:hypothetical protein
MNMETPMRSGSSRLLQTDHPLQGNQGCVARSSHLETISPIVVRFGCQEGEPLAVIVQRGAGAAFMADAWVVAALRAGMPVIAAFLDPADAAVVTAIVERLRGASLQ